MKGPQSKSALPIVLGTVLDGVPESAVLGLTLLNGGIGVTILVAVFLSNLPEGLAATTGLRKEGWSATRLLGLWGAVMAVSAIASGAWVWSVRRRFSDDGGSSWRSRPVRF